jgi:hypothetical protein
MSTEPPRVPPSPASTNVIHPTEAKDPILILVLAFFLNGISYFVVGQWQKGIAAMGVWIVAIIVALITCGLGSLLFAPLHVAIVLDAYMQAKCLKDGFPIGQWTFFSNHL